MLNVKYVFRQPGVGYSLENLFSGVSDYLSQNYNIKTTKIILPYISHSLLKVLKNLLFLKNATGEIFHITGDVHYSALATIPERTVLTIPDCVMLNRTKSQPIRFVVFWLLWYYFPIRRAAVVTAISEKTRLELQKFFGKLADKVQVVPCHYDPCFTFSPKSFNKSYPHLLQIGSAPHKNLNRLLKAIQGLPCRLTILGKITDEIKAELLLYKIDYENLVDAPQSEVVRIYQECDIVTFVSLYEGFGLPVIEAQAVGRPVLASNISPIIEVAGDAACLVDPTDIDLIREGIEKICSDDVFRENLIIKGRINAERFSISVISAQYISIYKSLLRLTKHTSKKDATI